MKRILNIITKKAFISLFIFLVEILILIIFVIALEKNFMTFWLINYILNIITAFSIVNSNLSNAFKLTWVIGLILLPGIGTVLFFVFGRKPTTKKMKRVFQQTKINQNSILNFKSKFEQSSINPAYLQIMSWIWNISSQPTYDNTETKFFNSGESYFDSLITDLKAAKKSIFLEFFIICSGYVWNRIVEILEDKAAQGLDVRLIYDDFGSFINLPKNYDQKLNKLKIKTKIFNKIKLRINSFMNNRDHRKIVIIDNIISYNICYFILLG